MKLVVVGCGHWGKNLIRNFHSLGCLAGIFDQSPAQAEAQARSYQPEIPIYKTFESILADSSIDAVAIATPAGTHAALTIAALHAGKDVFVEKPLALTVADGVSMVDAATETGKLLMVGHLLLYHPAILKMQSLIQAGELGNLEYIYSNRLSMGKIRQEENALWSFAPHDISVLLYLAGRSPMQVSATGGAYLQANIADVTVSNLMFQGGLRAHIFVSWLHPYKEQKLVVIGSKKMLVFEDSRKTDKLLLYDKQIEFKEGNFNVSQPVGVPVEFEPAEPLSMECKHFVSCVEERREPRTTGYSGVEVLRVLENCQRSLEMNGSPIQLAAPVAPSPRKL